MNMSDTTSQLEYYRQNHFNPGGMEISDSASWESHVEKRINLYQRHLNIPLSLLRGRSVLEIGPNSGENALVLAAFGADLTLVEPNEQVLPRLRSLFDDFDLQDRIAGILTDDIQSLSLDSGYDLVIVEGFLNTLPGRNEMLAKIAGFLNPGGLAVISFTDRYGCLLESTKRMILWRACQLAAIHDMHGPDSLDLAHKLFQKDWDRINASRPFEVWWKDNLVSPLWTFEHQWSYPELIPLVEESGCAFYSSSPGWASPDHHTWYKDVPSAEERNERLLNQWARAFPYFLTGLSFDGHPFQPASSSVITAVDGLVNDLLGYTRDEDSGGHRPLIDNLRYPQQLDRYLGESGNEDLTQFNTALKRMYRVSVTGNLHELIDEYHAGGIGKFWGAVYHYLCISKNLPTGVSRS